MIKSSTKFDISAYPPHSQRTENIDPRLVVNTPVRTAHSDREEDQRCCHYRKGDHSPFRMHHQTWKCMKDVFDVSITGHKSHSINALQVNGGGG